jgi:hypothetical protein
LFANEVFDLEAIIAGPFEFGCFQQKAVFVDESVGMRKEIDKISDRK